MSVDNGLTCICGGSDMRRELAYDAPPQGETHFSLTGEYRREYWQCQYCGHMAARLSMNLSGLYQHDYVEATYGGMDGLQRSFERVVNLPPEQSDNVGRVSRIITFAEGRYRGGDPSGAAMRLLDVGSGLAVFPHAMRQLGWNCTVVDVDERLTTHAAQVAGVQAVCGDFATMSELTGYDAVTFNKVLEHVADPVGMLAAAGGSLAPGGFVYVEVPDGVAALFEGPHREEFFVEHLHVFSPASVAILAARAGFSPLAVERVREPSGKFTLRAFLEPDSMGPQWWAL
jgi:SAM-dependent methyltransferase